MSESHKARIDLCRNLVSHLDRTTKSDVETLKQIGVPIKFYIPPLLSLVLEKVTKGAEFGEAVWDVRDEFRQVRSLISKYGILFQDTSQPLKVLLETRRKIFRDIELLSKSFEKSDRTGFKEWADVLDTIPDILKDVEMGNIPKATVIAKLLALPIEQLRSIILKRRYSSLFKTRRDFYNITDYANLLDKAMLPYQRKWERDHGDDRGIFALGTESEN